MITDLDLTTRFFAVALSGCNLYEHGRCGAGRGEKSLLDARTLVAALQLCRARTITDPIPVKFGEEAIQLQKFLQFGPAQLKLDA